MHIYTLEKWQHSHNFLLVHESGERRTLQVFLLTVVTMVGEIIDVRALMGISTETEAGTKDVQDLATFIADQKIKALFIESNVPEKYVEAVPKAGQQKGSDVSIGGELFSDAMEEAETPEGTYLGMITHNVDTIVQALK